MRTSSWIKLIGILCIVFGGLNILGALLTLLSPEMMDVSRKYVIAPPNIPDWHLIETYTGLFVNIIYLLAGTFFLLKKSFALNFMYIALLISIFYAIIPLFIVHTKHDLIFVLISPFIDLLLLILVYRLRSYYYKPTDELFYPYGKYNLTSRMSALFTSLGLIFLLIPLSFQILWIYSFNSGNTQEESLTIFYNFFSQFSVGAVAYLGLVFSALSIIFCGICLESSRRLYHRLNSIVLSFSVALLLLILFQMM